jgi:hypothetical protein
MSSDKVKSVSETWAERYDDRDAEDLACERWSLRMALREQAMAQPFKNSPIASEASQEKERPQAVSDSKPDR